MSGSVLGTKSDCGPGTTSGPGLHLNHKVSWSDLSEYCTVYKDPGIELPIGKCGLIHVTSKKIQLQINQREYLQQKICTNTECKPNGLKLFRKTDKIKDCAIKDFWWNFDYETNISTNKNKRYENFKKNFENAIREFAITKLEKTERLKEIQTTEEIKKQLKSNSKWPYSDDYYGCCINNCRVLTTLIELGDARTLLSIDRNEITAALNCLHGGQAVGNNFTFLRYHVRHVYFYTNLIVSLNLHDAPQKWNAMSPGSYFRQSLMHDCDGQTFLYWSREFLHDNVYMKDMEAMRQLCKNCFQFLYFDMMLRMEVGNKNYL